MAIAAMVANWAAAMPINVYLIGNRDSFDSDVEIYVEFLVSTDKFTWWWTDQHSIELANLQEKLPGQLVIHEGDDEVGKLVKAREVKYRDRNVMCVFLPEAVLSAPPPQIFKPRSFQLPK
jgi:hypothetical protein